MNEFVYTYPTTVYFGEGAEKKHLKNLVSQYGKTVLLAYGGGSVKKSGIYAVSNKIPTVLSMVANTFSSAWQLSALADQSREEKERFSPMCMRFTLRLRLWWRQG